MEVMEETEIKVEVEELVEPLALVKRVEVEGEAEVTINSKLKTIKIRKR